MEAVRPPTPFLELTITIILEHYFASNLFLLFEMQIKNEFSDMEVPNNTTIHQPVTIFLCYKCSIELQNN